MGDDHSSARAQHGVTAADLVVTPSQFSVSYLDGDTVPTAEVVPLYVAEQLAAQAFDIGYHNAKSRTEHIAVRLGCDPSKVRRMRDPSAHKPPTIARLVQDSDLEFEAHVAALRAARAVARQRTETTFVDDPHRAIRAVTRAGTVFDAIAIEAHDHGPAITRDHAESLSSAGADIRKALTRMDAAIAPVMHGRRP